MRSLKIIHGALMMGVTLFLLVTAWVHRVSPLAPLPVSGQFLTYVGLGILAAGLLALRLLPGPDPAPAPGQTPDQWWMTSQGRLIVLGGGRGRVPGQRGILVHQPRPRLAGGCPGGSGHPARASTESLSGVG